jgi:hypothetical protein
MMQPMDTEARRRLAAERFELLQNDAQAPARSSRQVRLRVGGLLVAAGVRLAPETRPDRNGPGTVVGHSVGVIGTRR